MLSRWQIIGKEAQAVETFFFGYPRRTQVRGDDAETSGVVDYDEFYPHQCEKYAELILPVNWFAQ